MASSREERDFVHMGKRHATEQRAVVIGISGKDHINQLNGADSGGSLKLR